MKISTRGRYALRFLVDLVQRNSNSFIPLKDISKRQGISIKYLEQIASMLSKSGILLSVRGPQGGYKLALPPSEYTVASVLRITEGNLAPVACLETEENLCPRKDICSTLKLWEGLEKVIYDYLEGITLEQLAGTDTYPDYVI
ncbi:MAG: Rrf2 family transcriptional regulator [Treponema sp.]|nr:Rrf2 family transcriptional regulator [Treponema sp.]